jgi:hypothetical protein
MIVVFQVVSQKKCVYSGFTRNTHDLKSISDDELLRRLTELVAELSLKPDAPTSIRKLPDRQEKRKQEQQAGSESQKDKPDVETPTATPPPTPAPRKPTEVKPWRPERYKVTFTAGTELRDKLERLKGLMRSTVPDGDLAAIIEEAVTEKIEKLEAKRYGATKSPRNWKRPTHRLPRATYRLRSNARFISATKVGAAIRMGPVVGARKRLDWSFTTSALTDEEGTIARPISSFGAVLTTNTKPSAITVKKLWTGTGAQGAAFRSPRHFISISLNHVRCWVCSPPSLGPNSMSVAVRKRRARPVYSELLDDGGVDKLVPFLTVENCETVLAWAVHQSKRKIKKLAAGPSSQPDVP